MKTKKSKKKVKRVSITLPEREGELLRRYAAQNHTTCPAAVKRFVKAALKEFRNAARDSEPRNQLDLFDCIQVDIFNNTAKVAD